MARERFVIPFTSIEKTDASARSILAQNGFKEMQENGEWIWQKGDGFWTMSRKIKLEYDGDNLIVWAWIESFFGKEKGLSGFVGALPKSQVLNVIKTIREYAV